MSPINFFNFKSSVRLRSLVRVPSGGEDPAVGLLRCSTAKPSKSARQPMRAELWIICVQKPVINMPEWVLTGDRCHRGGAEGTMGCD